MSSRTWTDEQLIEAVKTSHTLSEVSRKLGLTNFGANSRTIKKYIAQHGLDTSHFWSRNQILEAARSQLNKLSNEEIFTVNDLDRKYIKRVIMRDSLLPYKCHVCNIAEWHEQTLSLHLDHINGINNDNRLENLRFLCPNCHSLTETYCGKQLRGIKLAIHACIDCDTEVDQATMRCSDCHVKHRGTRIPWPSTKTLLDMVNELGYVGTGKQLGVSDNAVKKRIRNHPDD